MSKPIHLALVGIVFLLANSACSADEPAKAKGESDFSQAVLFRDDLRTMKELSLRRLAEKDRAVTVYRFLWFPSFHGPISVRFVKSDQVVVLHMVRLKGAGAYEPGNTIVRQSKSVKLSRAQWERIERLLLKANFWTLPSHKRYPFGVDVMDGDFLVVEGVSDGRYHFVVRHSPPGGDFVDLCKAMLFMSGADDKVRNLWLDYRH